jgi:hypothetical protein
MHVSFAATTLHVVVVVFIGFAKFLGIRNLLKLDLGSNVAAQNIPKSSSDIAICSFLSMQITVSFLKRNKN